MPHDPELPESLKQSLSRINQALVRPGARAHVPSASRRLGSSLPVIASAAGTSALVAVAAVTGLWWFLIPALGLGIFSGLTWGQRLAFRRLTHGGTRAHVGIGASIAGDAVIEPGAAVEMGASVGSGATIRSGAVVRMGASVSEKAVIEGGAMISWGASVGAGAVVGANATIGAGADVAAGARVLAGTSVWPGTSVQGTRSAQGPAPSMADPREARVQAACDRLEAELRAAPESVRAFLGEPTATVAALRRSCEDLLVRERGLRAESSPEALQRLDEERRVLEARSGSETDDAIRRSLQAALAAIDEQKQQRELLRRQADRLEAEQTRLLYTLEGMATQVVRLRTVGVDVGTAPTGDLEASVSQLRAELDAITDALEAVSRPTAPVMERIAEAPAAEAEHRAGPTRTRE
jgi:carbonic anhydrase/acetyltransferase-like protein (isoleucine patch superfamily)